MIYKKIIKIGTNVLTHDDGRLDLEIMRNIVEQIANLKKNGIEIIVVTSGAVGSGKFLITLPENLNEVTKKQVYAAIGQPKLMSLYSEFFMKYDLICAQILATKMDFCDKTHFNNMKSCFEGVFGTNVISIVNENDTVSVRELMFTDNDELAGLLASMMGVDSLIILTNVDGVYNGDPKKPESQVIPEIKYEDIAKLEDFISPEKSKFGRGGMLTKSGIAKKLSNLGVTTHIINGKKINSILKVLNNEIIGTKFIPKKSLSSAKRWVAVADGYEKGIIYVSKCAEEVLMSKDRVASLLPVGVIKIDGEFKKGDILKIKNEKNGNLGYGMAQYDSKMAREFMGQKNKKELVHYDYLYIDV